MKLNNFQEDLKYSNEMSDELFWIEVYRKAFPDYSDSMRCLEKCQGQNLGIDRIVYLTTGHELKIDEKKRREVYKDILIEYKHIYADGSETIGWIEKQLQIDYLAYAFMPINKVLFYDWQILRRCWLKNKIDWLNKFKIPPAHNKNYDTFCVAIPFKILHKEISINRIIQLL